MRFQLTVAQQGGDATVERRGERPDRGSPLHIFQLVGMLGEQLVFLERMDELLIGEFRGGSAHRGPARYFRTAPRIELLQDRQNGANPVPVDSNHRSRPHSKRSVVKQP